MAERIINQYGDKSFYIERNNGAIYVGNSIEEPESAFNKGSYELYDYAPSITPAIHRSEVDLIKNWIEWNAATDQSARIALLYGKAGIGKSVVMHDLLVELNANPV